jgi:tyrosyl-tRNA synthetase
MLYKSELIKTLQERGFIYQGTDLEGLDKILQEGPITAYVGFDCTAPSFHVGNLMQIMLMRFLQKAGHKPLILLGGATTRIGDPSDKDGLRKKLPLEEITKNQESLAGIFSQFLDFSPDNPNRAEILNNLDWLSEVKYLDFLSDYGVHFSINRMLTFDSVKSRLERQSHLTFLEFNYMILQGYDFLELSRRYNCKLEFGGSDQWGNIVSGVELARRVTGAELFGITTPLITTSSGAKMGKTASGAVWLKKDLFSHYDYWQFWRNTDDADVIKFMKLYTDISLEEIKSFEGIEGKELNQLKKRLADEATSLCHGPEAAKEARDRAEKTFEQGSLEAIPTYQVKEAMPLYKLLVEIGAAKSGNQAKQLILGGAVRINNTTILDPLLVIDFASQKYPKNLLLEISKKLKFLLKVG